MAFKLSKKQTTWLLGVIEELETKDTDLQNSEKEEEKAKIVSEFNILLANIREQVETIAEEFRSDYDNKSETWQDSDRGQEVDDFICQWENLELEDLTLDEFGDPENLDFEVLRELPTEI